MGELGEASVRILQSVFNSIHGGLFGWDSSPELNTKKLDNSPIFSSVNYTVSSDQ
jgi:hypothetical protein